MSALAIISLSFPALAQDSEDEAQSQSPDKKPAKTKASPERPTVKAPKPGEYYFKNDADRFFKPDELKPLLAGDKDFYVLFHEDMTGRPRGVALLIPDWGQNAANSRGIEFLRTILPDYGWVTLSMTVPPGRDQVFDTNIADTAAPPSTTQSTQSEQQNAIRYIDEDFMSAYELQLKMRMQALTEEAENHQGYFIVIAQGSSAAALASLYAKEELPEPEALIFLSASVPDMALTKQMNQNITSTAIPTLDIYQSKDARWTHKNISLRRKLAKKNFKISYRQKELYGDISYHNQNHRMLKVIYGWLSSLGL